MAKEKVVLAYSGGLDTSVAIKWLQEKYDLDVIAMVVDVGQAKDDPSKDLESVKEKALKIGAIESHIVDAREEFACDFILPALKANALYEGKYPLVSALSRPLIAKWLVETAKSSGAKYVAHGCTGKGNDQVRFEVSIGALDPSLEVIAPVREWAMSREETIKYAKKHRIPVSVSIKSSPYSVDENLWGRTVECGILEDPWVEPPADVYEMTVDPIQAPDRPQYVEVGFLEGVPKSLNGREIPFVDLITRINEIAGSHGYGRIDMIENRLVGIKSREIYEVPGALALIAAHRDLEDLTLERELLHYKSPLEQRYAELVYYGLWYSPLKEALDDFISDSQRNVTGIVRLRFYKGSCNIVGRKSEKSLYDYSLATYGEADEFSHELARGFIKLWGLPLKLWARKSGGSRDKGPAAKR